MTRNIVLMNVISFLLNSRNSLCKYENINYEIVKFNKDCKLFYLFLSKHKWTINFNILKTLYRYDLIIIAIIKINS